MGLAKEAGDDAFQQAKTDAQAELEAELERLRSERDALKAQLDQLQETVRVRRSELPAETTLWVSPFQSRLPQTSSDLSLLRTELTSVMKQLEAR